MIPTPPFTLQPTKFSYASIAGICFAAALFTLYVGVIKWDLQGLFLSLVAGGGGIYFFLDVHSERAWLDSNAIHYTYGIFILRKIDIPLSEIISAEYFFSWVERPFQAIALRVKGEEKKSLSQLLILPQNKCRY